MGPVCYFLVFLFFFSPLSKHVFVDPFPSRRLLFQSNPVVQVASVRQIILEGQVEKIITSEGHFSLDNILLQNDKCKENKYRIHLHFLVGNHSQSSSTFGAVFQTFIPRQPERGQVVTVLVQRGPSSGTLLTGSACTKKEIQCSRRRGRLAQFMYE